jgi:DegV family protein with EDD domain
MPVVVVTDSTAYLPDELVEGYGIHVVPLYVVLAGHSGREGSDISPGDVARALGVRGQSVSTSRPTPGDFVAAYRRALDEGADRLVSVHLSSKLSGTWDAARLAASQVGEHIVTVVDTRSAAMGAGFAVLAAARSAAAGADPATVARTAQEIAEATRTFFVVDTLEHRAVAVASGPRPQSSGRRSRSSPCCTCRTGASSRWRRSARRPVR